MYYDDFSTISGDACTVLQDVTTIAYTFCLRSHYDLARVGHVVS